jgi:AraC-like DNA-binding protein
MPEILKMEMEASLHFVYKTNMNPSWSEWDTRDIGLRILAARRQYLLDWNFDDLVAPHWRLYHLSGKGAWVRVANKRTPLTPDQLWLVPPETSFCSGNDLPITQAYVHFSIRPVWRTDFRDFWPVPLDGSLEKVMAEIVASKNEWHRSCLVQQWVLRALTHLPEEGFAPPERDARLRRMIQSITDDPAHAWSNEELADQVGMHPNALVRWFKHHTGRTPRSFLMERRVQESCLRLHHSHDSIEEIAVATGFCDRYHFSRVFKNLRGMGPATFRRKWAGLPVSRRQNDWSGA